MNQDSGSPPATDLPMKRKRGRPRKDESLSQQDKLPITLKPDSENANDAADDLMGKVVSGVVEGSFDAGYFLSVNVKDTDKELRGVVFIPDKVTPITAANDVAPHVKRYEREEIFVPSLDLQIQPVGQTDIQNQTESGGLTADKNQTASRVASFPNDQPVTDTATGLELQSSNAATDMNWTGADETRLLTDIQIKDIGGANSGEKIHLVQIPEYVPGNQVLPLMPQAGNGEVSKQDDAVRAQEASEACNESNTDTEAPKDSVADATGFVDFFPHHKTTQEQATGSGSNPNLVLFQDETKPSGTEQLKSPAYAEPRGFNLMTGQSDTPMEDVPRELQLELGNKITSGVNPSGANPQTAASKGGFLSNLFQGEGTAAKAEEAASESCFCGSSS